MPPEVFLLSAQGGVRTTTPGGQTHALPIIYWCLLDIIYLNCHSFINVVLELYTTHYLVFPGLDLNKSNHLSTSSALILPASGFVPEGLAEKAF